jgi:thymidine phosphorylase
VVAVLTGMDEPLGCEVGNALEVKESIECLGGNGAEDLMEVTLALSAQMLLLTNIAKDEESALSMLKEKIESGAALEKFKEMVGLHGGDISMIDDPSKLPEAEIANPLLSPAEGTVVAVDAGAVGRAALLLGAGRVKTSDKVDHAVGISSLAKIGMRVSKGDTLAIIHARDTVKMEEAGKMIAKAFKITHTASAPSPRIKEIVR